MSSVRLLALVLVSAAHLRTASGTACSAGWAAPHPATSCAACAAGKHSASTSSLPYHAEVAASSPVQTWSFDGSGPTLSGLTADGPTGEGFTYTSFSFERTACSKAVSDWSGYFKSATPSPLADNPQTFSIEAVVNIKSTATQTNNQYTGNNFIYRSFKTDLTGFYLSGNIEGNGNGMYQFGVGDRTSFNMARGGAIAYDTWTHVVGTYDNSNRVSKLYVDGSQVATATLPTD